MGFPLPAQDPLADPSTTQTSMVSTALLGRLQYVTDAALAHLTTADLLDALVVRVQKVLSADTATALLYDTADAVLVVVASAGAEPSIEPGTRIPIGRGFAGRVALDQRALTLNSAELVESISPGLRRRGYSALLGAPLIIEGAVIGVLHVGSRVAREFSADDVQLLQLVADRAALAIDHARLFEAERRARLASDAAVRARDEFLTIAAHELKTPLTAVTTAAQLLARRVERPDVERAEVLIRGHSSASPQETAGQAGPSERPARGSNLLGLYITAQVIEQQRGTIHIEMDPDQDMAVTVWLPLPAAP